MTRECGTSGDKRYPIGLQSGGLGVACAISLLVAGSASMVNGDQPHRLLEAIDCTKEYAAEKYFAQGDVEVTESAAGRYREAEAKPLSRFGYRFKIEQVGQPHLAVVRYPDDKRRYMCMMNGTCYDLTTGVFTDFAQPLSGKMLEIRQVFWPRWKDCSIVFMTWGNGEPAAVADIRIYEMDGLPALEVPGDPGDGSRRELGIQYEDPCGTGASQGAMSHEQWVDRMATYARYSGQGLLVYPIVWYHGPHYPSEREPSGNFNVVVGKDRRQYIRWTSQPEDWVATVLETFERQDLRFRASLTLLRLGSLMEKMNIDLESISAGKETINNMLGSNLVQAGTDDWTGIYNVRNFPKEVAGTRKKLAYGEKAGQPYRGGPIFNPLHPVVQEAILGVIGEIVDRYGKYPAFEGISLNMWHSTILWYASLDAGYDDYTVALFEKESGIQVPVDPKAPGRFAERHAFLTGQCRAKWVAWRCKKIHELFCRIQDRVVAARPDLRMTVTLWTETTLPALLGIPQSAAHQLHARKSTVEVFREGGFDVSLFHKEPEIEIDYSLLPARDRDGWGTSGADAPLEHRCMFRDHDFLDTATLDAVRAQRRPGAFLFNCWVEAWGKHKWFPCEPDDTQARQLAVMSGKPAEGIFRMNSAYPEDGFWWDSQLRITPPFQAGVHFMEYYAHALAELDACRITRGGLFLDTAHSDQLRRFARAYRALPAEKFETVGPSTDPVAVRTLLRDGRRYVYLVNRDYYPISIELKLKGATGKATDLATGEEVDVPAAWKIVLGPYQLRSFSLPSQVAVEGFAATAPEKIVKQLTKEAQDTLQLIKRLRAVKAPVPAGTDKLATGIEAAARQRRLAWLRRALFSYPVQKCKELAADANY